MVSLKSIQYANRSRSSQPKTAVFLDATSGIGLAGIEVLLKHTKGSTIFIVGRSQSKFEANLSRLQSIDPTATITFIEAQISLLREIDNVCATISAQTKWLDLLWLSQGGLGLREGSGITSEGLPADFAVAYYGRILVMKQLASLLSNSAYGGRIVSVLCAGMEGPVNLTDLGLRDQKNYETAGFWGAQRQGITMQTLAMRHLSGQYPNISFIHTNPGMVSTEVHSKWSSTFTGLWAPVGWLISLLTPLIHAVGFTPEQAGEIGIFELLDDRFSVQADCNFHRLNDHADEIAANKPAVLLEYEAEETIEKIWDHTIHVFDNVRGDNAEEGLRLFQKDFATLAEGTPGPSGGLVYHL